ncbi:hypothetical protein NDU88_001311 [Pleurodeles waltl]|uniref:Uncharacterized protein n=1 Tax=Pleurodeles waltl TaxID=8319 RepID=A0AAV7WHZ1_PLEWA|nr:hypothetical protein NDU88_001311 [Pleurodeles waltl]
MPKPPLPSTVFYLSLCDAGVAAQSSHRPPQGTSSSQASATPISGVSPPVQPDHHSICRPQSARNPGQDYYQHSLPLTAHQKSGLRGLTPVPAPQGVPLCSKLPGSQPLGCSPRRQL